MTALPPSIGPAGTGSGHFPAAGLPGFGLDVSGALGVRWSALHDAAAVVAQLAGEVPQDDRPEVRDFPTVMRDADGWRRRMAEEGIDDITAIMEAGLSALIAAHARGIDPTSAALALWQEFEIARDGLLVLAPLPTST